MLDLNTITHDLRTWYASKTEKVWTCDGASLEDTDVLGAALERVVPDGTVIALVGTLGAGKTRFVRAAAQSAGVAPEDVTSPTFVLIQEYRTGKRPIFHFDAYRLKNEEEFWELGPEEYFDGGGLTFVEWADLVENCMPLDVLEIHITQTGETSRHFLLKKP